MLTFQHTAARRRLQLVKAQPEDFSPVSTHSRPKAAAVGVFLDYQQKTVSTHSRPKAAALLTVRPEFLLWRFNTQPPEGGCHFKDVVFHVNIAVSTHSRPKAAATQYKSDCRTCRFQHTAARRRLRHLLVLIIIKRRVSTHSRPKAAASRDETSFVLLRVSTHSRPKAAAKPNPKTSCQQNSFNTQPPEGGCLSRTN